MKPSLTKSTEYISRWNMYQYFPDTDIALQRAGIQRHDLRDAVGSDDEIYQCVSIRRDLLTATPSRVEPASDLLYAQIQPHIQTFATATINSVMLGYAVVELVWNADGSLAKAEEKPIEWFSWGGDGKLYYYGASGERVECDPRKFIVIRHNPTTINPQGESLYARLYSLAYIRKLGWKFWSIFLERSGQPLLAGATEGDVTLMLDALNSAVQDATIAHGLNDKVYSISSGEGSQFPNFISATNKQIRLVILGETLTSEISSTGSYAAATVHAQVLDLKRRGDIKLMATAIQQMTDLLCTFQSIPKVQFVMTDDVGLEKSRAERDAILVSNGMLKLTKEYLLDRYDFRESDIIVPTEEVKSVNEPTPEEEVEDDSVNEPTEDASMSSEAIITMASGAEKIKKSLNEFQAELDDGVEKIIDQMDFADIDKVIQSELEKATSPEDAIRRLLGSVPDDYVESKLINAIINARLIGFASIPDTEESKPKPQEEIKATVPELTEFEKVDLELKKVNLKEKSEALDLQLKLKNETLQKLELEKQRAESAHHDELARLAKLEQEELEIIRIKREREELELSIAREAMEYLNG